MAHLHHNYAYVLRARARARILCDTMTIVPFAKSAIWFTDNFKSRRFDIPASCAIPTTATVVPTRGERGPRKVRDTTAGRGRAGPISGPLPTRGNINRSLGRLGSPFLHSSSPLLFSGGFLAKAKRALHSRDLWIWRMQIPAEVLLPV